MNIYRTSAYVILQMFNMNIYIPLYAIEEHGSSADKLVLENVKIEPKGAFKLFGSSIRQKEGTRNYYLDRLSIYKIGESPNEMAHSGGIIQELAFGAAAPDFSMLKTILEHKRGQDGALETGFSSEIKIKSIEVKIPLIVQIFLHMPIVLVAIITFYLFLSFGIDDRGLSDKEIEKIPLYLYSEQDCINKGCSICLEDFETNSYIRRLRCEHVFHKECVDKWFHRNFVCPICRNRVLSSKDDGGYSSRGVHVL